MDIDVDVFDFIPSMLRKTMVHHSRIYMNRHSFSDFIVTGGRNPVLYEINGKNIFSSFQLSGTIFKDVILPNSMPTDDSLNISFNVFFSYKKKVKEPFLFLRIDKDLAILGKVDKQYTIHREFKDIVEFRINDFDCTGEPNVEIVYLNGTSESFELDSLSYSSKGVELVSAPHGCQQFDKITRSLEDRVVEASCELAKLNIQVQKELDEYRQSCQIIDQNVHIFSSNENIRILSRYGDFWIRNVNDHIVIGIPLYNCSTSKNLVEKIHVSVFPSHRTELLYTHKLYAFQTENASIEPLRLHEICEETDEKPSDLLFNHEWTPRKQFVLFPDNAAIIIIKMDLKDFEAEPSGCEFDVFALYDVFLESGSYKEFQTHLATVKIDSDIFHEKRYAPNFDSRHLFRDLLAVIATTERKMYRIKFQDDAELSQLQELLLTRLSFDSISTSLNIEESFRYFLSQNLDLTSSVNHFEEDHQMFYCQQDKYWNGTLIRIRTVSDPEDTDSGEAYEIKIYNKNSIRIQNLITTFQTEFGRKISVEPMHCTNRAALELELYYQFREERKALDELAKNLKYKTSNVQKSYNEFIDAQHKTDSIWSELIDNKSE